MTTTHTPAQDLSLTQLIDALTAHRDTHGDKLVRLPDGHTVRSVTVTDVSVHLHQSPRLAYRPDDGIVLRDGRLAGHILEGDDDRFTAFAYRGGTLGTADTIQEAVALFDQEAS